MKILFVNNDLEAFLAHRHWFAKRLKDAGHEIILASGGRSDARDRLDPRIGFIHLDLDQHKLNFRRDVALVRQFRSLVHEHEPDVVHTFTAKPNLFMAIALLSMQGNGRRVPSLVMTFPGLGKIFEPNAGVGKTVRRKMVGNVFRRASKKLALRATFENERDLYHFADAGLFTHDQCAAVFGAGIDLAEFRPAAVSSNKPVFLFAGRLLRAKGIETFIQAANAIDMGDSQAEFQVAGQIDRTNPDCFDIEAEEKAGRLGRVNYLGSFAPNDMPGLFAHAQVLVLPTRLQEGFPRSLIEGASCGLALIASDQPSIRQIVYPGENGWLLENVDVASLKKAMQEAINMPEKIAAYQARSVELANALPVGEDSVFGRFMEVYEACLSAEKAQST